MRGFLSRIVLLLVCLFPLNADAVLYTSVRSGTFSAPHAWNLGAVPGTGDTWTIAAGHTLTVDADVNTAAGTVAATANLVFRRNGSLAWSVPTVAVSGTVTVIDGTTVVQAEAPGATAGIDVPYHDATTTSVRKAFELLAGSLMVVEPGAVLSVDDAVLGGVSIGLVFSDNGGGTLRTRGTELRTTSVAEILPETGESAPKLRLGVGTVEPTATHVMLNNGWYPNSIWEIDAIESATVVRLKKGRACRDIVSGITGPASGDSLKFIDIPDEVSSGTASQGWSTGLVYNHYTAGLAFLGAYQAEATFVDYTGVDAVGIGVYFDRAFPTLPGTLRVTEGFTPGSQITYLRMATIEGRDTGEPAAATNAAGLWLEGPVDCSYTAFRLFGEGGTVASIVTRSGGGAVFDRCLFTRCYASNFMGFWGKVLYAPGVATVRDCTFHTNLRPYDASEGGGSDGHCFEMKDIDVQDALTFDGCTSFGLTDDFAYFFEGLTMVLRRVRASLWGGGTNLIDTQNGAQPGTRTLTIDRCRIFGAGEGVIQAGSNGDIGYVLTDNHFSRPNCTTKDDLLHNGQVSAPADSTRRISYSAVIGTDYRTFTSTRDTMLWCIGNPIDCSATLADTLRVSDSVFKYCGYRQEGRRVWHSSCAAGNCYTGIVRGGFIRITTATPGAVIEGCQFIDAGRRANADGPAATMLNGNSNCGIQFTALTGNLRVWRCTFDGPTQHASSNWNYLGSGAVLVTGAQTAGHISFTDNYVRDYHRGPQVNLDNPAATVWIARNMFYHVDDQNITVDNGAPVVNVTGSARIVRNTFMRGDDGVTANGAIVKLDSADTEAVLGVGALDQFSYNIVVAAVGAASPNRTLFWQTIVDTLGTVSAWNLCVNPNTVSPVRLGGTDVSWATWQGGHDQSSLMFTAGTQWQNWFYDASLGRAFNRSRQQVDFVTDIGIAEDADGTLPDVGAYVLWRY